MGEWLNKFLQWSENILKQLPLNKQTKAQTANHIFDITSIFLGLVYAVKFDQPFYTLGLFCGIIILSFICVMITSPKSE